MSERFSATYHVRSSAAEIEARAQGIAVEQSVEMPLAAITDAAVLDGIVGQVAGISDLGDGVFAVRIDLATATVDDDAGQLLNMAFGNTSLHEDVTLAGITLPRAFAAGFGGPRHGIAGLRARLGVQDRALTASALKPQGMAADELAQLAERMARGGLDFIKDDHGLADQGYAPFAKRVEACAAAVARGARASGHPTRYIPSLSGDLDAMRRQIGIARDAGLDCIMLAPMIAGLATMRALVRDNPDFAFFAHPSLGGAARIVPEVLIGQIFRLMGADAVIFPTYGGRFGYSQTTCRRLTERARETGDGLKPALPVPAGGMTLDRTREILDFYRHDTILLIGGSLLMAREAITAETARFVDAVAKHQFSRDVN
jgi:ribulose-bisphosphate carboxylase large chain